MSHRTKLYIAAVAALTAGSGLALTLPWLWHNVIEPVFAVIRLWI
jgi:hypothetical protein